MTVIQPFGGKVPLLRARVFAAEGSVIVGDVEIGEDSSIWFGAVIRGDVNSIRIGARTNVQDQSVVHVTTATHATVIGDDVTIGHRAVLHGCTVHDRCLVGIGAIVLDGAVVGPDAMIGAGALVPPGAVVPPGTLVMGTPARPKRSLTPEEIASLKRSAEHYVSTAARYREPGGTPP
ncbi:gamma carbonic anhydrase family protein [Anaeromyxobacter oryzisoli]|uniref:gamma carbonic anhydrase family protein n=1 Tax=Anaeromyxobacter oryzisoli TaxID=2925408 RepID=UPI001F5AF29B|nr:gamma carbonic anhydrase family protein [Anaeromyxobacter sp. SG63]